MKTSVVIFEDNGDFREALVQLINTSGNFTCTGAFTNCNNVSADIKLLKPQVILMDIDMNGMTGIEAVRVIRTFDAGVKINTGFHDVFLGGTVENLFNLNWNSLLAKGVEFQGLAPESAIPTTTGYAYTNGDFSTALVSPGPVTFRFTLTKQF